MDDDGFYQAEHQASKQLGMIPSNFVQAYVALETSNTSIPSSPAKTDAFPEEKKKKGFLKGIKSKLSGKKK